MDAFCLRVLIQETQAVLLGAKVSRVLQPDRWSLFLMFERNRRPGGLLLSVRPGAPRFEVVSPPRDLPTFRSKFSDIVTAALQGGSVDGVEQLGLERIAAVHFRSVSRPEAMTLYAEMLGTRGDFVLVDRVSGTIIDRLRSSSRNEGNRVPGRGELYSPLPGQSRIDSRSVTEDEFVELVRARLADGVEPARILVNCFTGFSSLMAAEVAARSGRSTGIGPVEFAHSLWKPFSGLIDKVAGGRFEPRLLVGNDAEPVGLAAFPLVTVPADRQIPYSTMSEAAAAYFAHREGAARDVTLRARLFRRLNGEVAKAERLSARLEAEKALYGDAELHARKGRLLLANRAAVRRGRRVVELPDYADPEQRALQIELDPALSVDENAERYFALHRKAKRGTEIVTKRLDRVAGRLAVLRGLRRDAEEASELGELQQIEAALGRVASRPPPRAQASSAYQKSEGPAPRLFRSSDGLPILVGKSGAGNDHLTWRIARSHDLWFHAQGSPGSHVIVRLNKGKQAPPLTLREAAQIAAYYSRARGQTKVPVDYALRKYLRKPKGAAPGVVLLSQEKTIVVKPDPGVVRRLHPSGRDRGVED